MPRWHKKQPEPLQQSRNVLGQIFLLFSYPRQKNKPFVARVLHDVQEDVKEAKLGFSGETCTREAAFPMVCDAVVFFEKRRQQSIAYKSVLWHSRAPCHSPQSQFGSGCRFPVSGFSL
jgi:hypothetical protein